MSDAAALRKIANDLRAESRRRNAEAKVQSGRVIIAAVGLAALRGLMKGRP